MLNWPSPLTFLAPREYRIAVGRQLVDTVAYPFHDVQIIVPVYGDARWAGKTVSVGPVRAPPPDEVAFGIEHLHLVEVLVRQVEQIVAVEGDGHREHELVVSSPLAATELPQELLFEGAYLDAYSVAVQDWVDPVSIQDEHAAIAAEGRVVREHETASNRLVALDTYSLQVSHRRLLTKPDATLAPKPWSRISVPARAPLGGPAETSLGQPGLGSSFNL